MRKIYLLIILISSSCISAFSQEDKDFFSKIYRFHRYTSLHKSDINGNDIPGSEAALPGHEFRIVDKKGNNYILRFSKWDGRNVAELNQHFFGSETNPIYFKIPVADFPERCEEATLRHTFTLGVVTLPIKMRFGGKNGEGQQLRDFTFNGDINLGLSAGYKYTRGGKYSHNLLTGIALTSVPVSAATTNNLIADETNLAAITWHLGWLFSVDNFQFGAFTGIDFLGGEAGRQWSYRNQPWLGIGIGYSIFQPKKTTDKQ